MAVAGAVRRALENGVVLSLHYPYGGRLPTMTLLLEKISVLSAVAWLPLFRLELILLLSCAVMLWPAVGKALRNSGWKSLAVFAAGYAIFLALLLIKSGSYFFTFEDWEELRLGRLILEGDLAGFYAGFRHGTTYPFLLSHVFAQAGAVPKAALYLNISLLASVPPLLFMAGRIAFPAAAAGACSALLFCAWPGMPQFAVLSQGKPALLATLSAAFVLASALTFSTRGKAAFGLLFIIADLAARTRQEFAILYAAAFLIWLAAEDKKSRTWWIPALSLAAAASYLPLLQRGLECHIVPVKAIAILNPEGKWELAFYAAAFLSALAFYPRKAGRIGALPAAVPLGVFAALSAIYLFNPAGAQARLFAQAAPFLCAAAGTALSRRLKICAVLILAAGVWAWTAVIPRVERDTPAAIGAAGGERVLMVLANLDAFSEWGFFSKVAGSSISLDGAARLIDLDGGPDQVRASAGYRWFSGNDVWLVARESESPEAVMLEKLAAAGHRSPSFSKGGWRLEKVSFPGEKAEPAKSKDASDEAVRLLWENDLERGEKKLQEALLLNPADTDALLTLGWLRARQGRREDCLTLIKKAAALTPQAYRGSVPGSNSCGPPK